MAGQRKSADRCSGMGELFPAFQAMETVGYCGYRRNRGDAQVSVYGENNEENTLLVCVAFLLFPFQILSTAGYIATIANYLYPFLRCW